MQTEPFVKTVVWISVRFGGCLGREKDGGGREKGGETYC